ncbi:hypothetical protein ACVC7V_23520 [Hydrogenophaga sp. A37]
MKIGNSVGVLLPGEVLSRLRLEKGQTVFLTETEGLLLNPCDPALEGQKRSTVGCLSRGLRPA